jgi:predicted phage-related endonuclease
MSLQGEWHGKRGKGLGGTDIPKIVGLSSWGNALDVYLKKLGLAEEEQIDATALRRMWWGNYQEEGIAFNYECDYGVKVLRGAAIADVFPGHANVWKHDIEHMGRVTTVHQAVVEHPDYPFIIGTPDALVPAWGRGLEFKTIGFKSQEWGAQGTDRIPEHYLAQCLWYMGITGLDTWDLVALFSGHTLEVFTIERRKYQQEIDALIEAGVSFWQNNVLKQVPPEIDGTESWSRYLAKKFALGNQSIVPVKPGTDADTWALRLRASQSAAEQAAAEVLLCKNQLAQLIGGDKGVKGGWGKVQWIRPKASSKTDYEAAFKHIAQTIPAEDAERIQKFYTNDEERTPFIRSYFKDEGE